ncbi:hypothetical protein PCE1_003657 [Barthelona sp. PCE]
MNQWKLEDIPDKVEDVTPEMAEFLVKNYDVEFLEEADIEDIAMQQLGQPLLPDEPILSNHVVIYGFPIVDTEKAGKLKSFALRKFKDKLGKFLNFDLLFGEDDNTFGCALVEYADADKAKECARLVQNLPFDKKHRVSAFVLSSLDEILNIGEEYTEPEMPEFEPVEYPFDYVDDPDFRSQIMYSSVDRENKRKTTLSWFKKYTDNLPVLTSRIDPAGEMRPFEFSADGRFILSYSGDHIMVFGCSDFRLISRFYHPGVRAVWFSPSGSYIVSISKESIEERQVGNRTATFAINMLNVWDINQKKSTVPMKFVSPDGVHPKFKMDFSGDDRYFCFHRGDSVFFYDLHQGGRKLPTSFTTNNLHHFTCSPCATGTPVAAGFVSATNNKPGHLILFEIPSGSIIKSKTLLQTKDFNFEWHPQGRYFAVSCLVGRKKTAKRSVTIEILKMQEPEIPIEIVELGDDMKFELSFEPHGDHLSIEIDGKVDTTIQGAEVQSSVSKRIIKIYDLNPVAQNCSIRHVDTFKKRKECALVWNPVGQMFILKQAETLNDCEVYAFGYMHNVDRSSLRNELEIVQLCQFENRGFNNLKISPCGQFIASIADRDAAISEGSFTVFSLDGQVLFSQKVKDIERWNWRPLPAHIFEQERHDNVLSMWKTARSRFIEMDRGQVDAEFEKIRGQFVSSWEHFESFAKDFRTVQKDSDLVVKEVFEIVKIVEERLIREDDLRETHAFLFEEEEEEEESDIEEPVEEKPDEIEEDMLDLEDFQ